ncbi:MAG: chemotaxis protein CheA [Gemmatimonadota bacterium]|nr:chemotaxis protein CheA [Gemmatimonadota bacterium]
MSEMDEIVREFLVESTEGLDQLDRNLVLLEQNPGDKSLMAAIFRCIHTVKGTSGFLGYSKLEGVTHVGESLLSDLRDGKKALTPKITSALLQLVDAVRRILTAIEATAADGQDDYPELIALLTRLQKEEPSKTTPLSGGGGARGGTPQAPPAATPDPQPSVSAAPASTPAVGVQVVSAEASEVGAGEPRERRGDSVSESSIRVDVGLLDKLMNLVGELVLARNQILQFTAGQEDGAFNATSQRLNLITTELQEGVMKSRMQPIGNIWGKFPRVVRDLALACSKQVRLELEGKETELDKTIIEAIKDPLTHIVRNSVDHGIEPPATRLASGKPAEGCLRLRAYHEGGQVNIEISDDGAGIDPERIRQKAIDRGIVTAERATRMSDREVFNLVFLPGFSTAAKVTNVSGRGVGMDVVKTNIEKIGGTVDIQSKPGEGTTLKIKIPLTLAIIPALIVTTGGERYAIPQVSLLELVRVGGDREGDQVEWIRGVPVYRLRGQLLPLVYLSQQLGLEQVAGLDGLPAARNIVVLQADERQFGLVVDGISDTEEIVVKPLSKQLKGIPAFAGATTLGDGKVALILDVLGLAQRSGVVSEVHDRSLGESVLQGQRVEEGKQTMLVFQAGADPAAEGGRMAVPLGLVARLEEFPRDKVEGSVGRSVVQYRGQILHLISLSELLGTGVREVERDTVQVIVYSEGDRSVGVMVDRILDIVEEQVTLEAGAGRSGLLGSAIIQNRVTDLVDLPGLIRAARPDFIEAPALAGAGAAA